MFVWVLKWMVHERTEDNKPHKLLDQQLSVFFCFQCNTIITVHENTNLLHVFQGAHDKLLTANSRIRRDCDSSWWIYVICDAIVDSVFDIAQCFGTRFGYIPIPHTITHHKHSTSARLHIPHI
jgi:hypothetical protein